MFVCVVSKCDVCMCSELVRCLYVWWSGVMFVCEVEWCDVCMRSGVVRRLYAKWCGVMFGCVVAKYTCGALFECVVVNGEGIIIREHSGEKGLWMYVQCEAI